MQVNCCVCGESIKTGTGRFHLDGRTYCVPCYQHKRRYAGPKRRRAEPQRAEGEDGTNGDGRGRAGEDAPS
jgi:hypothetical protein